MGKAGEESKEGEYGKWTSYTNMNMEHSDHPKKGGLR
jgi:hypothetical protein